ncbi:MULTISPECIES: thermonuclease family protein [unclassified Pseudodesulfovibrio]|uniref:thermonuclease family protein n=1 Tax=unclassified Pseudodesulfovibrio TaxID=2661612 RepID=UPI000FEBB3FB|nr:MULTISPECIES: thermonuclease family protein [unclassified Pseudodesulfovibrio]MCJ2165972.1 thermonuclease family protein [Pseudodesulfovibrio sp. S3-i]RWU02600.1 thermonuclease family protein [Pseudodesulfovibrio sp. S3]
MIRRNTIFFLCLLCFSLLRPATASALTVRFLSVIDGDSLLIEHKGDAWEIRLIGIDAPEFKQEYGVQAKVFSLKFCHNKTLRLEFDREKKDRYGRRLAYVYADDVMLNEELVRAGLAIPIMIKPNTRYYARFKAAEKEAVAKKCGFWLRGGLKQTPAQWRKSHPGK